MIYQIGSDSVPDGSRATSDIFSPYEKPKHFMRDWKEPHVVTFQLVVGGKILSMFINPIMWIITVSYFAFRPIIGTFIESFIPHLFFIWRCFLLFLATFYMYYYMIGCAKA